MKAVLRISRRTPLLVIHILWNGFAQVAWMRLRHGEQWYDTRKGQRIVRRWMFRLCRILGLRVTVDGLPSRSPCVLFASNHISWLDIIALNSIVPARFVSKASVRKWPLFGALVASTGTLFLRRESARALADTIGRIRKTIDNAVPVTIFPEGTTTDGEHIGPFHGGLFQVAVDTACRVQPVALSYRQVDGEPSAAPFIGNDGFVWHLLRVLGRRKTRLDIRFGRELRPPFADRRALARQTREAIIAMRSGVSFLRAA